MIYGLFFYVLVKAPIFFYVLKITAKLLLCGIILYLLYSFCVQGSFDGKNETIESNSIRIVSIYIYALYIQ